MDKITIANKFMDLIEREFNVKFVDVTPDPSFEYIAADSVKRCNCGHYLRNHTESGCPMKHPELCGCKVRVRVSHI